MIEHECKCIKQFTELTIGDILKDWNGDYVTIQSISTAYQASQNTFLPRKLITEHYAVGTNKRSLTRKTLKNFFKNDGEYFYVYNEK